MKNPNTRQPDSVSGSVGHEGVDKPMNDPMGTQNSPLDTDNIIDNDSAVTEGQTDSEGVSEGLTPMHRQNIDEARVDEVLVEDALDDKDYPSIRDIADNDAVQHSHEDDL